MGVLASVDATCKENGVYFENWLLDVPFRLDACHASELKTLFPHNWKPEH